MLHIVLLRGRAHASVLLAFAICCAEVQFLYEMWIHGWQWGFSIETYKKQTPLPRLVEIRKFEGPPVYFGPLH